VSANAVLVDSFENSTLFSNIAGYSTTVGVTDGLYSGWGDPPTGWNARFQSGYTGVIRDALASGTVLELDVTLVDTIETGYAQIFIHLLSGGQGSTSGNDYFSLTGGGVTDHIVFDYSSYGINFAAASWGQIRIGTNMGTNDFQVLHLDNVRVTPEPAMMSLLGLGGLALLRRRK
jgi:MYXO-CTERM domain-containing protein